MIMIKAVFADFDGTLTSQGQLTPLFFKAVSYLQERKIPLIITTGRGLAWSHFLLTYISYLKIVIAEGGGVITKKDDKGLIFNHYMASKTDIEKLNAFCLQLEREHPQMPLSLDSFSRITDRAVELDDYLRYSQREAFDELLNREHICSSRSNVHLNFWCGDISKYKASLYVLNEDLCIDNREAVFFGDSLNDETMFQHFENSVGVANISAIQHKLRYLPKTILQGPKNEEINGVLNYLQKNL